MASQDYISQYTQGIPPTQPERSPSRTPRRDPPSVAYDAFVPGYRGPLHMATQQCRNPCFGYTPTWTPPRLPTMPPSTTPSPMSWNYMVPPAPSVQPLFPPAPPTYSPPPPPPQGSTTPQRFTTTSPKSHSSTQPSSDPLQIPLWKFLYQGMAGNANVPGVSNAIAKIANIGVSRDSRWLK